MILLGELEVVKKIESPLWKVLMRRGILLSGAAAAKQEQQPQYGKGSAGQQSEGAGRHWQRGCRCVVCKVQREQRERSRAS